MPTRSPASLVLLIPIVVFLNACSNSETPTEPGRAVSTSGTVHIFLMNASTSELGLPTYVPAAGVIGPLAVKPGDSVELKKWNFAVTGDHFFVFQPVATAESNWKRIADVTFNVRNLPTSTTAEISSTVRVTADASGAVTAVSDRPDVIEIVSVTPQ